MVDVSSLTTISTHFRLGSFNFCTCFFTMASKARSGVKRPVLHSKGQGRKKQQGRKESEAVSERERKKENRKGKREREREKKREEKNTRQNEKWGFGSLYRLIEPGEYRCRAHVLPSIGGFYWQMEMIVRRNRQGRWKHEVLRSTRWVDACMHPGSLSEQTVSAGNAGWTHWGSDHLPWASPWNHFPLLLPTSFIPFSHASSPVSSIHSRTEEGLCHVSQSCITRVLALQKKGRSGLASLFRGQNVQINMSSHGLTCPVHSLT